LQRQAAAALGSSSDGYVSTAPCDLAAATSEIPAFGKSTIQAETIDRMNWPAGKMHIILIFSSNSDIQRFKSVGLMHKLLACRLEVSHQKGSDPGGVVVLQDLGLLRY